MTHHAPMHFDPDTGLEPAIDLPLRASDLARVLTTEDAVVGRDDLAESRLMSQHDSLDVAVIAT